MKQFEYVAKRSGVTCGPYGPGEAAQLVHGHYFKTLGELEIGGSFVDLDGDAWVRLPDRAAADEPQTETGASGERLERIALEYLRFLGPAYLSGELELDADKSLASCCVTNARELIAELDKLA